MEHMDDLAKFIYCSLKTRRTWIEMDGFKQQNKGHGSKSTEKHVEERKSGDLSNNTWWFPSKTLDFYAFNQQIFFFGFGGWC